MDAQDLYLSLGQLLANVPEFLTRTIPSTPTSEAHIFMARAYALTAEAGLLADAVEISATHKLLSQYTPSFYLPGILTILHRALAVAELRAPAAARGSFIPAGSALDAMAAIGKVLSTATSTLRIVDPYMDEKAVTDFAVLASELVKIELLADDKFVKPSLSPAIARWRIQYPAREIEARVSAGRSLHDRLIIVDGVKVWTLTQSLNAFAARAPASIILVDLDTAALKVPAYDAFWNSAAALP